MAASARGLKFAKEIGKEVGKEAGKIALNVAKGIVQETLEEKYHGTTSDAYKKALKVGMNTIGAVRSVQGGPQKHILGQQRKEMAKRILSVIKERPNTQEEEPSILKPIIAKKDTYVPIVPYTSFPVLRNKTQRSAIKRNPCDTLYEIQQGDFYICKKDSDKCTDIHATRVGELATIVEAAPDCLKDVPLRPRKCKSRNLRDLPHDYAIYDCPDEEKKMQGGRGRRASTRRGRRTRRRRGRRASTRRGTLKRGLKK